MMYLLGVLFMAVAIGLSIALHELGHLVPAKRFGVVCRQYMIGFGPTLWSRRIGETEYGIKAVPLGGYVRMIGMYPPTAEAQRAGVTQMKDAPLEVAGDGGAHATDAGVGGEGATAGTERRSRVPFASMIAEARAASLDEIRPGEEDRVFYKLSTPKKLTVMLGGIFMNLLIAGVVMAGVLMIHGVATPVGAQVAAVAECVRPVTDVTPGEQPAPCTAADRPSPAAEAGLVPGDQVLSIGGQQVTDPLVIMQAVRPAANQAIPVVVDRGGQRLGLQLTPIPAQMPALDAEGVPVTAPDGTVETVTTGYIGLTSAPITEYVPQHVTAVPGYLLDGVVQTAEVVLVLPVKLVGVFEAAFLGAERDQAGPMSVVGVGRIAGEVAGGQVEWLQDPGEMWAAIWMLVASLNIALLVFNLVPLLPLDGGHMAGALWEGARRGVARVAGRPDPGYADIAKATPLAWVVSLVFLGMGALLIYADVVSPIRL